MADLKISELSALAGANLVAADELAIVDDSASETKKITVSDLIANGVTVISDDTIPGAKILFAAGDIATAALADSAVTTAKVADDAVTAAKLANESTVDLVTTLPASGAFTGQLALDTDDNSLYAWDGSAWQSLKAPGSINTVSGSTTGEVNIVATTSGSTVTVSATLDDTTAAAQFLAGPTGAAGTVGYRAISGTDLPTATTSAKGGVIVNGNGLTMDSDTIEIDNTVTASSTHHVVTYNAQGLITGGRAITSADLPIATSSAVGGVIAGSGLAVDVSGNLSIDNTVTSGTYTKVTVSAQGVVTAGDTLAADDIPDHSAAKLTSGTIGTSLIANDAITAAKMADQSTVLFGGALGSDNVTIFPSGDYKGQMFWDETSEDLYIYTGSAFIPITVLSGNLVNAGAYNANTNTMSSVTTAGSSAGFSAGAALPAPAASNLNHYVVVDTSGTGSGAAPAVALAPPDMLLSQGVGTEYSLIDVSNAIAGQTASNISFIASGNIAATDVQAALQEVDTEKLQKAGDTMTGALGIGTASSIVFEGSSADDYETTLTVTDPTADRTITLPNVTGTVVTTGDTGSVTSTMILDGTIANADISSTAEIAVSKLANGTARQLLQTDSGGTGVEFTSNVDVPGTLDVTGAATLDSTLTVTGLISADGKVSFPAGTAAAPSLYSGSDTDTGIYSPGSDQFGITTAGTSRVVIDSSGRLLVGTSSFSENARAVFRGNSGGNIATVYMMQNTASVLNSQDLGRLHFSDANASIGATIAAAADSTWATNDYPTRLEFSTTADGASSPSERMRIDSSGNVGIGDTSLDRKLQVIHSSDALMRLGRSDASSHGSTDVEIKFSKNYYSNAVFEAASHRFEIQGTEKARLDASGRLLVGTTTEGHEKAGNLTVATTGHTGLTIRSGTTSEGNIFFSDGVSGTDEFRGAIRYYHDVDELQLLTAASSRMYINSSGNVGIGTASPASRLHVADGGGILVQDTGGTERTTQALQSGNSFFVDVRDGASNGQLVIRGKGGGSASEYARFDTSGRLLVGTSSTSVAGTAVFQGSSASSSANADVKLACDSTAPGDGGNLAILKFTDGTHVDGARIYAQRDGGTWHGSSKPTRLIFATAANGSASPTERMRISNDGTVAINNGRLYVQASTGNPLCYVYNTNNTSTDITYRSDLGAGSNGTSAYHFYAETGGSGKFAIYGNGTFGTISDQRLKTHIETARDGYLDDLNRLNIVKYGWKIDELDEATELGVIAQEVEQVFPGLIQETPPNEDGEVYKGVKTSVFTFMLIKALQEASDKIETLEAKVAALEAA